MTAWRIMTAQQRVDAFLFELVAIFIAGAILLTAYEVGVVLGCWIFGLKWLVCG